MNTDQAIIMFIIAVPCLAISAGCVVARMSANRRINKLIKLNACRCNHRTGAPDPELLRWQIRCRLKSASGVVHNPTP